ncbi:MAG: DUF370 domain-containing protein [Clostridia bacterium]|nr:DUF370 domain-containing protein [Clostridia bacterium]
MDFISVGYGNIVNVSRIIAVTSANSAPAKRTINEAKENGRCVDATQGRRTKAILVMDSDHVVLSALHVSTLLLRLEEVAKGAAAFEDEDDEEDED